MNNKGFISTSVILALIALFVSILVSFIAVSSNNRKNLNYEKDDIKASLKFNALGDDNNEVEQ